MSAATDPFVGRTRELGLLRSLASGDGPAAAIVSGPPGIGKSRLVDELGHGLRSAGGVVAVGRTWPDGDGPALWPWFELLDALGVGRDVLAGPAADRAGRFARTIDALATVTPPPTLVLEDLHAADEETLLLTRLVVRAAGTWRGTVIGTRRPGPTGHAPIDALLAAVEDDAHLIPLDGLDDGEVATLLRRSDPDAPDDLARLVGRLTGGNPLHLRALAAGAPGRARWLAGGLEERIATQVAALGEGARRLVEAAAVIGGAAGADELAAAIGASPATVESDLRAAGAAGLVVPRPGGVALAHDVIRTAVLAALAPTARGAIHTRLAAALARGTAADRGRGAQHGLAAAELGAGELDSAVAAARQAATDLHRGPSLVAAAALLDRAVAVSRARGAAPTPELLVERAEATLACGRLQEARPRFEEAAREAERAGDAVSRARAALGLGGVWLGEHRDAATARRIHHLQCDALAALPPTEGALRARLALRLAAENAYPDGDGADLRARLDDVRATGDRRALVEGLSLVHHASMHPGRERDRLVWADEQLAVATASGDELGVLVALVWRAVDLFLAGDPGAGRALGELARRADAVHCTAVVYVARVLDVMLLLRAGRLDDAERAAQACLDLGTAVGDADAVGYYGVHLFAVRTWQGREAEVLDVFETLARSPEHPAGDRSVLAGCALLAARAGRLDRAATLLHDAAAGGLASINRSTTWLAAIVAAAEAAHAVGDEAVAAEAYDLLLPHAELPVMPSFAVACFGSVHRALGHAARATGRTDDAIAHLRAAVDACERLGNEPARLLSRADLSAALAAAGDAPAARHELEAAVRGARDLGLDALAARWTAAAPAAVWSPGLTLTQVEGGTWEVVLGDDRVALPDLVGCRYLAHLVSQPGREVPVLRLALGIDGPSGRHAVVDGRALGELRRRVDGLRSDIAAAEERGDTARAAARREELDAIARHLATSLGLGGRVRSFDDLPERARTSVQKAVRRVIDRIEAEHPLIGGHLRGSTRTGLSCCYDPSS